MVERLGGYKVIAVGVRSKCYILNVLWVIAVGVCSKCCSLNVLWVMVVGVCVCA